MAEHQRGRKRNGDILNLWSKYEKRKKPSNFYPHSSSVTAYGGDSFPPGEATVPSALNKLNSDLSSEFLIDKRREMWV